MHNDSTVYGGGVIISNDSNHSSNQTVLDYENNSPRFEFAAGFYENVDKTEYRYQLEGFDKDWSSWSKETKKDYTQLPEGDYTFRVKARNVFRKEGTEAVYPFTIRPPWQRTWWAYGVYILLFSSFIWALVQWRIRHLQKEKLDLEKTVLLRTAEIKQKNGQLEHIEWITRTINSEIRLYDFICSLFTETRFIKTIKDASALTYNHNSGTYRFITCRGTFMDQLKNIELTSEEAEARYIQHTESVAEDIFFIPDAMTRPHEEKFKHLDPVQSMLVLRIHNGAQAMCYLIFDYIGSDKESINKDIQLLSQLKPHIVSGFIKIKLLGDLEESNGQLKTALSEVKSLSGLLPICAGCKKIRDDKGYWNQIENYISDHSEAEFSHGLCPDCQHRLYPELFNDEKETLS